MVYVSSWILFISYVVIVRGSYNPIPIGSVIISTTRTISVLRPREYDGSDRLTIIFTANKTMTIVNTIFDPRSRELYVIFSYPMTNILYLSQLKSVGKLHRIIHQLPIAFNVSELNRFTSFSSDTTNKRVFFTDRTGKVTMFSMGGAMKTVLSIPSTITQPVRSVGYNEKLNRLFLITDSTVHSCINLDQNDLQCCSALPKTDQLRSIAFDRSTMNSFAYVIDEQTGIYQVVLNSSGCPMALRPMDTMNDYQNLHLMIYQHVYFASGSNNHSNHNSILLIGNGTQTSRTIPFDASIVALHISYPNIKPTISEEEICFHGITYYDYRLAVILAAIFGSIMGIFMCFNALFCIDFFMTKRIIRDLKKQIPHNLLEDRWNRLVQEKYAKLALDIHRKQDDPQPKRKSSAAAQKVPPTTTENHGHQVHNPLPRISAYLRRKSEGYLSRRRSDECHFPLRTTTTDSHPIQPEKIQEEPRKPMTHDDVAKPTNEFL